MNRPLLSGRWLLAHATVLAVMVVFVGLGFWQLGRLEERQQQNRLGAERWATDPQPLVNLVAEENGDVDDLVLRRAFVTGVYDGTEEVLIRSQVHRGTAGYHVVIPLVEESGEAVLVNRGWVPLAAGDTQIAEALPPEGEVTIEGWIHATQTKPPFGRVEPAGELAVLDRIDIARIQQQSDHTLAPVYVVEIADRSDSLPIPVPVPTFDDEGSHLGYALQWFGFAVVVTVGYPFLVRRRLNQGAPTE